MTKRRSGEEGVEVPSYDSHRQPEQATESLVDDPGRHLIPERDGAAQGAGERGDHGGATRLVGQGDLPGPRA
ncbi:hypothetical protein [Sorangium sp. So ce233]|uniref:hypothetical protein n=1 Tax=Sorangium sp. So ce233 TaxID=3133290 RepID=UPI003F5F8BC7